MSKVVTYPDDDGKFRFKVFGEGEKVVGRSQPFDTPAEASQGAHDLRVALETRPETLAMPFAPGQRVKSTDPSQKWEGVVEKWDLDGNASGGILVYVVRKEGAVSVTSKVGVAKLVAA